MTFHGACFNNETISKLINVFQILILFYLLTTFYIKGGHLLLEKFYFSDLTYVLKKIRGSVRRI